MRLSPTRVPDLRDGYVEIVRSVLRDGREREARGYLAYDVADASFTVEDPAALLPYGVGREIKPEIGYAEALLLCGGIASPSLLTSVSPAFARFVDGGSLAGAYGPLTRPQLPHVVRSLMDDRDTRQAVLRVHPGAHEVVGLRDVPCTISLGFELRPDGLHMRAVMRSNDVWLGLAYDAFVFGQLGWTIANLFGVELVTYTHFAYSLHLYERNREAVERLYAARGSTAKEPLGFGRFSHDLKAGEYELARVRAEAVYERESITHETKSEGWYRDALDPFDRLTRRANFTT